MKELDELILLYVEDELSTLLLYEKYFKSKFKTVYTARDGIKALESYENLKPDLIILDINLPYLNGLDVAKKIREKDNQVRIILLTACDDKETLIKAIGLNILTYLEKPMSRNILNTMFEKIKSSYDNHLDKSITFYENLTDKYIWNFSKKILLKNQEIIKLTKKETLLMELFMNKPNEIISFETIYDYVWIEDNYKNFSIPSIKTLIKNLRMKLPELLINSSYGNGFIINLK
ncbi:MAG: response regulator transcription factor [Aliarcobacter sp.]